MVIVLGGGIFLQYQRYENQRLLDEEIQNLVNEQNALTQKNLELEQSLKFFATNEHQEKLAKEQLGLQREGEIVVNFPQDLTLQTDADFSLPPESNPAKWWRYLFKSKTQS